MIEDIKISIILPVFNAADDLKRCLASVLKYTDSSCRVLIIDDASTDPQIPGIIQDFCDNFPSCTSLKNPQNMGFVRTCNRGFTETRGSDIILLNSDTVVTKGWIRKLSEAAYSFPKVASVTPLTNNGTVCSVPNWLEENTLPEGFTIEKFAEFIEETSLRAYPSIPTAIGFCMYIRREALEEVGDFNEVDFGKGYGEENDWCYRANKAGYQHIIDDSTFIYHAGSKSFGPEKLKIIEANFKKIDKLHPTYHQDVADFIQDEPMREVLENLRIRLQIHDLSTLKPVCFILHNSLEASSSVPLGGTEFLCLGLKSTIQQQHPVYVLYPDKHNLTLNLDIYFNNIVEKFRFKCTSLRFEKARFLRRNATFHQLLLSIFSVLKPSILHIHHLLDLSLLDMTAVLRSLHVPVLMSLHDFYFVCPSYNLIDVHQRFCAEYKGENYCSSCIPKLYGQGSDLKKRWNAAVNELFSLAHVLIAPSESCADIYREEYSDFADKIKVISHGLSTRFLELAQAADFFQVRGEKTNTLRVGFVGGINRSKGSEIVRTLVMSFWNNTRLRDQVFFKVIGKLDLDLPKTCRNFTITGKYEREELPKHLADVDVVVFPAQWAETYCLVADEVMACGLPVITTPIGAVPERVRESNAGWITQDLSANSIEKIIIDCVKEPKSLVEKRRFAQKYQPLNLKSVADIYFNLYAEAEAEFTDYKASFLPHFTSNGAAFNRFFINSHEFQSSKVQYAALTAQLVEKPRTKVVRNLYFLKERFPKAWDFVRLKALRMGLIE